MNNIKRFLSGFLIVTLSFISYGVYASYKIKDDVWQFQAFLDDDPIGYHTFEVKKDDDVTTVFVVAKFDVDFLFFNVYSYEHTNKEIWGGSCLKELSSTTNDNGKDLVVNLRTEENGVNVYAENISNLKSSCVRSFAYWDPDLLNAKKLINSQTGEILDVNFEFVGNKNIFIKTHEIESKQYRLVGKDLEIDLWYSLNNEWLGLGSKLENGRYLRYELVDRTRK